MKLDRELYEKISSITLTEYDVDYPKEPLDTFGEAYVWIYNTDSISAMLEDLLVEIGRLEEKIEDIIQDREDNYKRMTIKEQLGDIE